MSRMQNMTPGVKFDQIWLRSRYVQQLSAAQSPPHLVHLRSWFYWFFDISQFPNSVCLPPHIAHHSALKPSLCPDMS